MVDYVDAELFEHDSVDKQLHIAIKNTSTVLDNNDIVSESFQLIESLCSEECLMFGAVEPRSVKFTVKYSAPKLLNKWVTITMSLEGSQTPFEFGDYQVVSDKPSSNRETREVTAYSHYHKILRNTYKNWYKNAWGSSDSMTIKEFRDSFFARLLETHSWVVQETTTLPNDNAIIKKTKKIPRISGKDILNAICEINGVFGYIGRDGIFHYLRLDDNQTEHEIANTFTISTDYEDYTTTAIDRVQILSEDGDVLGAAGEDSSDAANTYTIKNNFMLKGLGYDDFAKDTFNFIASNLLSVMDKVTYVPFEAEFKGNPCFEIGDRIVFNSHGQEIRSYILERTMSGIQSLRDSYSAQGEEVYPEDSNTLSSRISKVEDAVGIVDTIKSTNYVGTSDPTSGGGGGGGGDDAVPGKDGDLYIHCEANKTTESISALGGMSLVSSSGNANDGYNATGLCVDDYIPECLAFVFDGLNVGGTYTLSYENQIVGSHYGVWYQFKYCMECTASDHGAAGVVDGTVPTGAGRYAGQKVDITDGFCVPFYNDANNHSYSVSFTATSTTAYVYFHYDDLENTYSHYMDIQAVVKNVKIVSTDNKPVIKAANVGGEWRNVDYAKQVTQTQTSGTEIAEVHNSDGTTTKIYQKDGGLVDDVKVDGASVVTNKIANINTMTGATSQADGAKGLVPKPESADYHKYLRGDGTWHTPQKAVSDLTDVDLNNLSNGQVLKYNNTSQKWENANESGGGGGAEMLSPTPFIYSEDEEQVGIWIDGKPLYQKTFDTGSVSIAANGSINIDTRDYASNIERIVKTEGYCVDYDIILPSVMVSSNVSAYQMGIATNPPYVVLTRGSGGAITAHFLITLYYTKTTDTAWQGGFKTYGFTPVIYSDTEREIGVWRDGKPLYAKTILRDTAMPYRSWVQFSFGTGIKVVDFEGLTYYNGLPFSDLNYHRGANANEYCCASGNATSNRVDVYQSIDSSATITCRVTAYYTKDSDMAGSGKYTTLGTPSVHYDDTERVVGTWFGETLWQKTIDFGAMPNNTTKSVAHGISNIKRVVSIEGYSFNSTSGNLTVPLPFVSTNALGSQMDIRCDFTNVTVITGTGRQNFAESFVTLKYTKTS